MDLSENRKKERAEIWDRFFARKQRSYVRAAREPAVHPRPRDRLSLDLF